MLKLFKKIRVAHNFEYVRNKMINIYGEIDDNEILKMLLGENYSKTPL